MRWGPLAVARVVAAAIVVSRVARIARVAAPVRPTVSPWSDVTGGITVVVPARDEATRIGPLLAAVVGAPGVHEVVVVDDGSTDGTGALAAAAGARVVDAGELRAGWTGKAWALQRGVEAATTEWVVTLDADTRPSPRLPGALVARARADGLGLLTVSGRFECPTAPLGWLHPALLTTLVYRYGPPGVEVAATPAADGAAGAGRSTRLLANGQCTTLRRAPFLAAGGMAPVAHHTVEDVALARHLAGAGWAVGFLDASDLLTVRMYESFGDAWRGWGRSLALPGVEPTWRQLVDLAVVVLAQALPSLRLLTGRVDRIDGVLLAVRLGTLAGTASAYTDRRTSAYWVSPLADPLAAVVLASGIVRRRRRWRGRTYDAPAPPPGRSARR